MATDNNWSRTFWSAGSDSSLGQRLAAIPFSDYVSGTIGSTISTGTSTGDFTTSIPDYQTYTVPTYPRYTPFDSPVETELRPRALQLQPLRPIEDFKLFEIALENNEVLERVSVLQNPTTNEIKTQVIVRLPETDPARLQEVSAALETEFKLAIIRVLRLVPTPQRLRTLILEEETAE